MREIKFQFIYKGLPYSSTDSGFNWHKKVYSLDEIIENSLHKICDVHGLCELVAKRQWTGEKDKNLVDAYEGDILKMYRQCPYGQGHIESTVSKFKFTDSNSATCIGEMPDIRVVVWHRGALMLQCRDGGHGHMKPFSSLANPGESFEIIGNTTQNHELMEQKQ